MLCVPLIAFVPLQPPEAAQDVAFVDVQLSVDAPPLATEVGLPVSVTVGFGGGGGGGGGGTAATVTAAVALLVPPAPVQVRE